MENEDWLAVWIGFIIIAVGCIAVLHLLMILHLVVQNILIGFIAIFPPVFLYSINACTAQNYYKYIAHYVTEADYEAVRALGVENPEAYDFNKILNR